MKKSLRLKTSRGLSTFLEKLVELSVNEALDPILENERVRQSSVVSASEPFKASASEKAEQEDDVDEAEDSEPEDKAEPKKKKDTTNLGSANKEKKKALVPGPEEVMSADLGDIITKLNVMRSGKSLKDNDVKVALGDYFDSLSSGERQSLYVFLSGLSQIMSSGVSGKAAPDPGEVGIKVSAPDAEAKPASNDIPTQAKSTKSPSQSSDTPIVVGEAVSRKDLLKKVKTLMLK
jgi:hypothetical protein